MKMIRIWIVAWVGFTSLSANALSTWVDEGFCCTHGNTWRIKNAYGLSIMMQFYPNSASSYYIGQEIDNGNGPGCFEAQNRCDDGPMNQNYMDF